MTEPTLLQQARERLLAARVHGMDPAGFHALIGAVDYTLQLLESWVAKALPLQPVSIGYERGPAQVPTEPKCKVCGESRSFEDHGPTGEVSHTFQPDMSLDLDELQKLCDAATPGPWKMCPKRVYFIAPDGSPVCDVDDFDNYGPIELRGHGAEVSGNRPAGSMERELEIEAAYWHKECVTANTGKPCPSLEIVFKALQQRGKHAG